MWPCMFLNFRTQKLLTELIATRRILNVRPIFPAELERSSYCPHASFCPILDLAFKANIKLWIYLIIKQSFILLPRSLVPWSIHGQFHPALKPVLDDVLFMYQGNLNFIQFTTCMMSHICCCMTNQNFVLQVISVDSGVKLWQRWKRWNNYQICLFIWKTLVSCNGLDLFI